VVNELGGFSVKIADVIVRSTSEDIALAPSPHYKAFVSSGLKPDIDIQVYCQEIPDIRPQQKIFDSGGVWSMYGWQGKYIFTFSSPVYNPSLYKMAIFDPDFARGEVYIRRHDVNHLGSFDPLEYPLDELLRAER
jgi:hypothetical protein